MARTFAMKILVQACSISVAIVGSLGCDASEADLEMSLSTIVAELNREHSKEEREKIFGGVDKVALFQIRNRYDLWNVKQKSVARVYFEEHQIRHPDWIAACIYEAWKEANITEGLNEKKLLREYAEKQLQWEQWQEELKESPPTSADGPFAPPPE